MNVDRAQLQALGNHQHEVEFTFGKDEEAWELGIQPERTPDVGMIRGEIEGPNHIRLWSTESGVETSMKMSAYNAFRMWVFLGMVLGLPIPEGTGIKL